MLKISNLTASYGLSQVLFGVDLEIGAGEVVGLLGRNGMGKTSTIMSTMGLIQASGIIEFNGKPLHKLAAYKIPQAGIGLVPEGRHIFPNLTVKENLVATATNRRHADSPWNLARVLDLFPRLGERLGNYGNQLSGGEQQMLAIARALMTNPQLLILDEATEGLAPLIRLEIWRCLDELKKLGQSILVVDKNLSHLIKIADRHYVLEKGRVVWTGSSSELGSDTAVQRQYLGV
ncbi:MAG TPA: ABC transporter ATP-binding protein [Eoetvoesiella sp.]|uniref:ABC transporter ATP-binding protein n=1 Tax=Eoetvoesiella sp. TaxID=1966355 RepID=UPI002C699E5C|nr:ABC transporter ATP-binding protein [Eoetvoesiella sp.]HWK61278.1 ABC transporter ATP-binding protein [Eoetvoesiella sp.]